MRYLFYQRFVRLYFGLKFKRQACPSCRLFNSMIIPNVGVNQPLMCKLPASSICVGQCWVDNFVHRIVSLVSPTAWDHTLSVGPTKFNYFSTIFLTIDY